MRQLLHQLSLVVTVITIVISILCTSASAAAAAAATAAVIVLEEKKEEKKAKEEERADVVFEENIIDPIAILHVSERYLDFIREYWSSGQKTGYEMVGGRRSEERGQYSGYYKIIPLWEDVQISADNKYVTFIRPFYLDENGKKLYFSWKEEGDQTRSDPYEVAHYLGFSYAEEVVSERDGYSFLGIFGQNDLVIYRDGHALPYQGNHRINSIKCKLQSLVGVKKDNYYVNIRSIEGAIIKGDYLLLRSLIGKCRSYMKNHYLPNPLSSSSRPRMLIF
ncbi:MAG: hypothetical protein HQK53_15400 [Oligoflexia bacterium]|nr:hypothetical protein [Oligoflexia bacterium]